MSMNFNKTPGNDKISVRIIKISDEVMIKPLSKIYRKCKIIANAQP